METAVFYGDQYMSGYYLRLERNIIQAILRWANMMYSRLKVGAPNYVWFHFPETS